jgi:hypothetical protein
MNEPHPPVPSHPLLWFPEFLELTRRRLQPQVRVLGLSLLVGVIAGLGAIVFFSACQIIFHYTLDAWPATAPATRSTNRRCWRRPTARSSPG